MEIKTIVKEIKRLPLIKRLWVLEQTIKSIKKEELSHKANTDSHEIKKVSFYDLSVNEKSLADDWLSSEDNRWDKLL